MQIPEGINDYMQSPDPGSFITIDDFQERVQHICDELPPFFFTKLSGLVQILPEAKIHPKARANDLFILGLYRREREERWIELYYGSFRKILSHSSDAAITAKIREILLHEFTHHLESLAGLRDLEIEDQVNLEKYLRKKS